MRIVLATQNVHKIREISLLLPSWITVSGIDGLISEELREDGETLEENALQKARFVQKLTGAVAMADDTGLEVDALNGAPGVYSARYGGEAKNAELNIAKLLREMQHTSNRRARFRTVIALADGKNEHLFEGIIEGEIIEEPRGTNGFGYDPVFVPTGDNRTLAELTIEQKGALSHRGKALVHLVEFLATR
ncbi:MAG TPA: RdgB/HAM1 family non-canonical purine NTP pyrophosphatase [Bacteroidia bacterium]|nr:RdgB/HAM1 family non-canonical purine NTP pyrophosphatase [Bacteroidia bacterium]